MYMSVYLCMYMDMYTHMYMGGHVHGRVWLCTQLVEAGASGLFNVSGDELLGRYAFGTALCDSLNKLRPGAPTLDASYKCKSFAQVEQFRQIKL